MKRIAAHIGLTVFCALAAAFYLSEKLTIIIAAASAIIAIVFLLIRKTRKMIALPLTAALIALSFGVNLAYTAIAVKPVIDNYSGENRQIEATLTDDVYQQYNKYYYRLTTDTIDGEEAHTKILLKSTKPLDLEPFDKIAFTADITPTVNNYYLAKGYYITVDVVDITLTANTSESKPLYYHIIQLRQSMRDAFDRYLPEEEANLCKAILIGDKYSLDNEVKEDFRESGVSYYIVVSGMHFSILCLLSLWLFRKIFRKHWIYFPLTYIVIVLYMMITGFQPSVMRSGIMMVILTTGQWVMRQSDPLTSLGIAGLLMPFIFSPYGCGDIGMILSFAATFSIIAWQAPIFYKIRIKKIGKKKITKWLIKGGNTILELISVSLAANILILPLSIFLFSGYSLMTLISSLLLYPLIWLIMVFSLLVCVFSFLGPLSFCSLLLSWPLYLFAKLTLWLVHMISSIPLAYIQVRSLYVYIWLAITLVFGITAYLLRKRYKLFPYVVLISAIVFVGGFIFHSVILLNTNTLTYAAGDSGSTVYLNYCGRIHMLRFDCNSVDAYQELRYLSDRYTGVQSVVCTSEKESENYKRMSDMDIPVSHSLAYRQLSDESSLFEPFDGSSSIVLDDGIVLNALENDGKLLLYLNDAGKNVMLIPDGFNCDAIPADMYSADVILIGKAGENYDRLRCHVLICTDPEPQEYPLPQYESLADSQQKTVNIQLN